MLMFPRPDVRRLSLCHCLKGCQQNMSAPVETMPDSSPIARFVERGAGILPADIFQGQLSHDLLAISVRKKIGGDLWAR